MRRPGLALRAAAWFGAAAFIPLLGASCATSSGGGGNDGSTGGGGSGTGSSGGTSSGAGDGGDRDATGGRSSSGGGSASSGAGSSSSSAGMSSSGGSSSSASSGAGSSGSSGSGGAGSGDSGSADAIAESAIGDAADGAASSLIAATPPMGWNSWNTFQCNLNEALIKAVADTMVSSGMQAAGYRYVNLDDCWMDGRDASGNLQWNATKFPSGIPALAAYVHSKGLKLGIYETPSTTTCVGIYGGISPSVAVGSLGHETQDANAFASWGVDFLKYDLCTGDRNSFPKMRDALRATGRPIVYSINPGNGQNDLYPPNTPGFNPASIANMWRFAFDINASYASVTSLIDQDAPFSSFAGPGHWNDADMLEVGKGMTADEDRSHFSMWGMLASPLLAGNDIRSMTTTTHDILTNADVITVNQDPLGNQGQLVATPQTNLQIWSKTLSGSNVRAVALLNRTAASASTTVSWTSLGLPAGNAAVRNLWSHTDLGTFASSYTAIPSHGVVLLRVASVP